MPVAPPPLSGPAHILVVDDLAENRRLLSRLLAKHGYESASAEDGDRALRMLRESSPRYDLVLLDIEMPHTDGIEVLRQIKADEKIASARVVMVSGLDDMDAVARCIDLGADDFISKPWDSRVILARVRSSLDKKRLHEWEESYLHLLEEDEVRSTRLISSMMPEGIARRLKLGELSISEYFEDVSILFADIVGFTRRAATMDPRSLVALLNAVFSDCDLLVLRHGLEKIKTIGDAYMVAGSLPEPRADHLSAMAEFALELLAAMHEKHGLDMRVGIHCGPAVAGVLGTMKLSYDVWGDTINVASRMESHGAPGRIHVSDVVRRRLAEGYAFETRGTIEVKGVGPMSTHFLVGRR